jgi:hypothetical protein
MIAGQPSGQRLGAGKTYGRLRQKTARTLLIIISFLLSNSNRGGEYVDMCIQRAKYKPIHMCIDCA